MGANNFSTKGKGSNLKKAYDAAYSDAVAEYGHQEGYSGQINSTNELQDLTYEFEKSKKNLNTFMNDKWEDCSKGMCYAICIKEPMKNTNKVRSQVKNIVTPGTRKWVLSFEVASIWSEDDSYLFSAPTKGEALKFARQYVEKNLCDVDIYMTKHLEKGPAKVAEVLYKGSKKEVDGTWIFFGLAAC
jgi:hypothetical protein